MFNPNTHKEPEGLFNVEIHTGGKDNNGWDLWEEEVDYKEACREARVVRAHNFKARIKNVAGEEING